MSDPMDFFRQLIASLPPGTPFLVGQTPAGDVFAHAGIPDGMVRSEAGVRADAPGVAGATPLEMVRALEVAHGPDHGVKVAEWKTLLQPRVKGREIERAIDAGTLTVKRKGDGRDGNARMLTVRAMVDFLTVREAAERDPSVAAPWRSEARKVA